MERCATCKHWRRIPDPEQEPDAYKAFEWDDLGHHAFDGVQAGICTRATDGNETMHATAYDDCGLHLITRAEFGCVLHEVNP